MKPLCLKERDDFGPARAIGPGSMDENYISYGLHKFLLLNCNDQAPAGKLVTSDVARSPPSYADEWKERPARNSVAVVCLRLRSMNAVRSTPLRLAYAASLGQCAGV